MAQIRIYTTDVQMTYEPTAPAKTAQVTAMQADLTYNPITARVTAMQANVTYK